VNDGASGCIKASATVFFWCADPKQAQLAHGAKKFMIEAFMLIVFMSLRLDVFSGPISNHFTEHQVFFTGICNVHNGHLQSCRGASPFSPFVDVFSLNGETDAVGFASFDLGEPAVEEALFRVQNPLLGGDVSVLVDLFGEAEKQALERRA
jgi:hypothetical protein